ncbi:MAG: hypothetical protein COB49_10075 [Alphaproteobacteria bacterium]|nr:MAG: hypothetical protein COB49_10075 [Alphaproteobacteria bacterium]
MKYVVTFFCTVFVFLIFPVFGELAFAQNTNNQNNPISEYDDCSDTSIDIEQSGKPLTKEERIALMERAFFSSLNKFDRCQTSMANGGASAAASNAGHDGVDGLRGEMNSTESTGGNSVASSDISGSDKASSITETRDNNLYPPEKSEATQATAEGAQEKQGSLENGTIPEDIPSGQNDSILEAQIRAAAEAEQDPAKKARLWNEYRRYKGLKIIEIELDSGESN